MSIIHKRKRPPIPLKLKKELIKRWLAVNDEKAPHPETRIERGFKNAPDLGEFARDVKDIGPLLEELVKEGDVIEEEGHYGAKSFRGYRISPLKKSSYVGSGFWKDFAEYMMRAMKMKER